MNSPVAYQPRFRLAPRRILEARRLQRHTASRDHFVAVPQKFWEIAQVLRTWLESLQVPLHEFQSRLEKWNEINHSFSVYTNPSPKQCYAQKQSMLKST